MSLYLKYRPQNFDHLVGQDFINQTLKKAITDDKTVGAYLFCGPRGTGKTSSARILAKTINCLDIKDGNPCENCQVCKDFLDEKLIDIIEIDAASHTGVDNIREIIEKAQFRPSSLKYKVYIIDEVHMLSTGAFNALLKILEEPPEYVKFILATTETHKVPETIISRCQRYDFKRISDQDIQDRLSYIAAEEGINIDQESLSYISSHAGGGLRNAISLFEQLISDKKIVYSDVIEKLGIVDDQVFANFFQKLLSRDSGVVDDFEALVADGKNMNLFFKQLLFSIKQNILDDLRQNDVDQLRAKTDILETLNTTYTATKHSPDENLTLLIGLLKILSPDDAPVVREMVQTQQTPSKKTIDTQQATPVQEAETEHIAPEDAGDIFADTHVSVFETSAGKEDGSDFDGELFINHLKSHGAKASLLMGIRGAKLIRNAEHLDIKFATEFAKKNCSNEHNLGIIEQALQDMELVGVKVNFC